MRKRVGWGRVVCASLLPLLRALWGYLKEEKGEEKSGEEDGEEKGREDCGRVGVELLGEVGGGIERVVGLVREGLVKDGGGGKGWETVAVEVGGMGVYYFNFCHKMLTNLVCVFFFLLRLIDICWISHCLFSNRKDQNKPKIFLPSFALPFSFPLFPSPISPTSFNN